MSWNDWVKNSLINCTDHGHSYMNVLTDAAIVGLDGAVWARTDGIDIKPDECKKLNELLNQSENNTPSKKISGHSLRTKCLCLSQDQRRWSHHC